MTRPTRLLLLALSILLGQPALADLPAQPRQVPPHAWAWIGPYDAPTRENRGFRMNLGFVVGTAAVAVIDSGYSPQMAEAMLAQVRR